MAHWTTIEEGCKEGDILFTQDVLNTNTGIEREVAYQRPGRKNISGEAVLEGWLGETSNINRTATGCVEVLRLSVRDETRAQVRCLENDDPRVVALCEELGVTV